MIFGVNKSALFQSVGMQQRAGVVPLQSITNLVNMQNPILHLMQSDEQGKVSERQPGASA